MIVTAEASAIVSCDENVVLKRMGFGGLHGA